jgi:hypothetical protein
MISSVQFLYFTINMNNFYRKKIQQYICVQFHREIMITNLMVLKALSGPMTVFFGALSITFTCRSKVIT